MTRRPHPYWFVLPVMLGLLATPVFAGETTEIKSAEAIGRGLVSPDETVRAEAIAKLQTAITKGQANEAFLGTVAKAAATWANNLDRLASVWIEQAVEGDARERRTAARLLHALGPDAVARLARELRHLRHRGGSLQAVVPQSPVPAPTTPTQEAPSLETVESAVPPQVGTPTPQVRPTAQMTRIYKVRALLDQGMDAFKIRTLLRKTANASAVTPQLGDHYVVVADRQGHVALARLFEKTRMSPPAPKAQTSAPAAADAVEPGPPPAANYNPPLIEKVQEPVSQAKWKVQCMVFQVPRAEASMVYGDSEPTSGVAVRRGTPAEAATWLAQVRKLPDARELARIKPQLLAAKQTATMSAGEEFHYTKAVIPGKGGAYSIVSGTLHQGYQFALRITEAGTSDVLQVQAVRNNIARPVPSRTVVPAKDATPITIEEPQWSSAKSQADIRVDPLPTSMLLVFQGLDEQQPHDDLVMVIQVVSSD